MDHLEEIAGKSVTDLLAQVFTRLSGPGAEY
jgi:hypothetical protein